MRDMDHAESKENVRLPVVLWPLRRPRIGRSRLVLSIRRLLSILVRWVLAVSRLAVSIWWRLVWCSTSYRPAPRHSPLAERMIEQLGLNENKEP
jgi:hypothetical protein